MRLKHCWFTPLESLIWTNLGSHLVFILSHWPIKVNKQTLHSLSLKGLSCSLRGRRKIGSHWPMSAVVVHRDPNVPQLAIKLSPFAAAEGNTLSPSNTH